MIAVTVMGMVQMAIDQIANVACVGHLLVTAVWTVDMIVVVTFALVTVRAASRIFCALGYGMLIDVSVMGMVQMAIVEEIDVAFVTNLDVTTTRFMLVRVLIMGFTFAHVRFPSQKVVFDNLRNFASELLIGVRTSRLKTFQTRRVTKHNFIKNISRGKRRRLSLTTELGIYA